jgi:hypothetical protein
VAWSALDIDVGYAGIEFGPYAAVGSGFYFVLRATGVLGPGSSGGPLDTGAGGAPPNYYTGPGGIGH